MSRALLYANTEKTVFVIDLPASIAYAQGRECEVASCTAITAPWAVPEPKGTKRARMLNDLSPRELQYHKSLVHGIAWASLVLQAASFTTPFNRSRWVTDAVTASLSPHPGPHLLLEHVVPLVLSTEQNHVDGPTALGNTAVINSSLVSTELNITECGTFIIPPRSSFLWADICTVGQHHNVTILNRSMNCIRSSIKFDMILMDPPWANRSVRRTRAYLTDRQDSDPFESAVDFVRVHLQRHGRVAIWITNKEAVRQRVLTALRRLQLHLLEQWIWVKTTTSGQPAVPLDAVWRKPYEVLLVFARHSRQLSVSSRYIFGVPDIHSRKPNLKVLFEMIFQCETVLELFARNLTAGWCSVGNEVLKFQDARLFRVNVG